MYYLPHIYLTLSILCPIYISIIIYKSKSELFKLPIIEKTIFVFSSFFICFSIIELWMNYNNFEMIDYNNSHYLEDGLFILIKIIHANIVLALLRIASLLGIILFILELIEYNKNSKFKILFYLIIGLIILICISFIVFCFMIPK